MKCRFYLLLCIIFISIMHQSVAQIKHYFTQNAIVYKDYFNEEQSKSYFPLNFLIPNFSHKLEYNRLGAELYFNDILGAAYHMTSRDEVPFTPEYVKNGDLVNLKSTNIGLAVHYSILSKPYLKICPLAGVVQNWYNSLFVEHWVFTNELYFGRNKESRTGFLTGVNINVPIWKGIYANTNTRYMLFPGAQYNKQNLLFDIGLGYMYQRKARNQAARR